MTTMNASQDRLLSEMERADYPVMDILMWSVYRQEQSLSRWMEKGGAWGSPSVASSKAFASPDDVPVISLPGIGLGIGY